MGEGANTRVQKDIVALQQGQEELKATTSQLHISCYNMATDLKIIMAFISQKTVASTSGEQGSAPMTLKAHTQTNQNTTDSPGETIRSYTMTSKLECPKFGGDDLLGWHSRIEQFLAANSTPENNKIRTVIMHLEGRALQWHLHYMRSMGNDNSIPWLQ